MHEDEVHDEPCDVDAEDGVVIVAGPADMRARFTPDAADETSERLATAALKARGQRYFSKSLDPRSDA